MVYVDNVKFFCLEFFIINDLKIYFSKHYKLRNLEEIKKDLGIGIKQADKVIILTQTKYLKNIPQKHEMQNCSQA